MPTGPPGTRRPATTAGPFLSAPRICQALAEAAEYLASRPETPDQVSALIGELARRGVAVQFVEARPDGDADRDEDGFVAELFADPIARDVARWAAERALAPAALMGISLGLGLTSAIWFTEPTVTAKAVAAVTLLAAFVSSRAGRLLAAAPGPVLAAIGGLGGPAGRSGRAGARSRVIQPAGDWLSAAGWAITECAVYAGLAASAGLTGTGGRPGFGIAAIGNGPGGVWHLAVTAMVVLAVRRMAGLCYERATEGTGGRTRLPRSAGRRRVERALLLPAGERVLLLIVAGGIWGPRVAFLALIGWGVLAAGYVLTARLIGLRDAAAYGRRLPGAPVPADEGAISLDAAAGPFGVLSARADGPHPPDGPAAEDGPGSAEGAYPDEGTGENAFSAVGLRATGTVREAPAGRAPRSHAAAHRVGAASYQIAAYRDDGPISLWLGRLVEGRIPPLPPVLVGVFVTVALALLGLGNLSGVLVLTPVEAMLLAGLGSCHPHDGRLDWLVPPLLQVGEYLFLAALAFSRAGAAAAGFRVGRRRVPAPPGCRLPGPAPNPVARGQGRGRPPPHAGPRDRAGRGRPAAVSRPLRGTVRRPVPSRAVASRPAAPRRQSVPPGAGVPPRATA